jgi:hypothetical protein
MSRTTDTERTIPDLDRELAALAEEAPEMPADFHEGWMKAIREETKKAEQPEQAKAESRGMIRQWRRLAGAAAIMVFLIGGTLLTRGRWTSVPVNDGRTAAIQTSQPAEQSDEALLAAAVPAAPEQAAAKADTASTESGRAAASAMAGGSVKADSTAETGMKAAKAAESREAAPAAAAEAAVYAAASEEQDTGAAMTQAMDFAAAYEAVAEDSAEEAEEAAETPEEETAEREAAAEEAEPAAAAVTPENTATPTEMPATEKTAQPAESGIGGFFTDMWQFILHVWPYMAGAAVLAGAAMMIRKKQ